MATSIQSAWGIEIGQAGLKAIRLRAETGGESVRATAFDYIPHPKILSQPDAVPVQLIEQSVATFLERNNLDNDAIGISVPGHTSLAKFIKLPPVEPGKVAEIVQYEARQQIPFALEEVIWDFQPIGGGVEESGFMLEAEVGLFAMKRELVLESMRPLMDKGEEIDVVQIAPLALYNYLSYDVLSFRKTEETPEPPDAEDYYIVLDMGADNTTLLVSNGRSIWIRNVPIGGNHFTRALTREMKLTFAKAEHLKCNATKSPDPKAAFQAMRPVFNDYVTEIQRSIGYFGSVNRAAKIKKVIGVGNGFKLAGLQKFLQQNLQYEVERLEHLDGVTGDAVLSDPLFADNVMSFAVPYGLALQTLNHTRIQTTLVPPEIVTERKIRSKKPWIVAAAAMLLLALGISTGVTASVARSLGEERFKSAYTEVADLQRFVSKNKNDYEAQKTAHSSMLDEIDIISAPLKKRSLWMELYKAVNECMPRDEGMALDEVNLGLQRKVRIQSLFSRATSDVKIWHSDVSADPNLREKFLGDDADKPPAGEGYIITLAGHHYHNDPSLSFRDIEDAFLESTLVKNLRNWTIEREGFKVPVGQLGISHPIIIWSESNAAEFDPNDRSGNIVGASGFGRRRRNDVDEEEEEEEREEAYRASMGRSTNGSRPGLGGPVDAVDDKPKPVIKMTRTDFQLQFAWIPVPEHERVDESESTDTPATQTGRRRSGQ
ncbi:MAG: type IV pilus assembly protein PilM [Fuerstiella sp.]|nr:type IV pilus assembly protein PilM [Fuerstiella sp.]